MNINRGNNRRRGRGNNNRQQGSGQQINRIDSRARGNAPQLLEKYRKLAHDAHLNGDRVTEEYYLQFADHYFRVLADARVRQDEQRGRPGERWQEGDGNREDGDDGAEYGSDGETSRAYEQAPSYAPRDREERPREDRPRDDRPRDDRPREDRPREDRPREDRPREDRPRREQRAPRAEEPVRGEHEAGEAVEDQGERQPSQEVAEGPMENPFTRDSRGTRGLRPRREDRRPRRETQADVREDEPAGLDPSLLPPPISTSRDEPEAAAKSAETESADAKPVRRTRRPRPPADDTDETLQFVG